MNNEIEYDIEGRVRGFNLLGFGTGPYTCKCVDCGRSFIGDKRAIRCLECVIKKVEKRLLGFKLFQIQIQEAINCDKCSDIEKINAIQVLTSELSREK